MDEFAADEFGPDTRRLGSLAIEIERNDHGDAATCHWRVCNVGDRPVQLESVVMGMHWTGAGQAGYRFLRHGWQSWSFTAMRDLDAAGEPEFPSGEWLRGLHHAVGAPPADRRGWHESDIVTAVGSTPSGGVCLAGVLECGVGFGTVYLRPEGAGVAIEVELRVEVAIEPGEQRELDSVRVALGDDANRLLEEFAELWGKRAGARRNGRFQTGWCSWYHFFHDVTEDDVLRNLDALAARSDPIPVDVIQLDDGYQRAIGDWLTTNEKFPRGLEPLARDIRAAGFQPGIWTAPFCVVAESWIYQEHRDWLLGDRGEPFRALAHPQWSASGWVYALDTSYQPVLEHVRAVFRSLVEMGYTYHKLDFLFAAATRADARDPRVTRAERLRRGLDTVREAVGDSAFMLGCGCPLGPAVGVVDGMRIGPDVAPSWHIDDPTVVPGLEPAMPATGSAVRSILHRAFMHRRLWLNDPDCLMARTRDTGLTAGEVQTLAASIAVTGGMVVFSDDVAVLSADDRSRIRQVIELARAVDAMAPRGAARAHGWLDPAGVRAMVARGYSAALLALINWDDTGAEIGFSLADSGLAERPREALLGSPSEAALSAGPGAPPPADHDTSRVAIELSGHESALYRLPGACHLTVFCDFDGTFSVDDVGAALARQYRFDRIPQAKERYLRGDVSAWEFTCYLLDGLELAEDELDRFLATVELDPGAGDLLAWCAERNTPFRVLSDGFDWILNRLQERHGMLFAYESNRLTYREGRWQIAPGYPNSECFCGTGTCKRSRIAAWRQDHPGAFCIHIGNGRISDLCGALEADLVFAKGSLARALDGRGVAYEEFNTLRDVVAWLDRLEAGAQTRT
ncbi:MAG: alpha-galactosidase [Proteobacteria bacterium]|nr:alpha-galactosidase [Pseudomonadota bacterium]